MLYLLWLVQISEISARSFWINQMLWRAMTVFWLSWIQFLQALALISDFPSQSFNIPYQESSHCSSPAFSRLKSAVFKPEKATAILIEADNLHGLRRDLNLGPLAPKGRIIPLDHWTMLITHIYWIVHKLTCHRPYCHESTSSRPITEVNHG